MMTTSTIFKVVLFVCIVLLVGLIVRIEMAAGSGLPGRTMHSMTIDVNNNL
jgi:hypothetical protein